MILSTLQVTTVSSKLLHVTGPTLKGQIACNSMEESVASVLHTRSPGPLRQVMDYKGNNIKRAAINIFKDALN